MQASHPGSCQLVAVPIAYTTTQQTAMLVLQQLQHLQ
jgi:hypothetical protein